MAEQMVLCALDNRDLARIFDKALRGDGYRVVMVHDGEQAQHALAESDPDLMLLDISLPKRDGFEIVQAACGSRKGGRPPVILLSDSRISPHYQERADSLGVELLLAKPVPLDGLLAHVGRLLKDGHARTTSVASGSGKAKSVRRKAARGKSMAGSFFEIPFPRLLHQLHGGRASGVLMVSNGRRRKAIQLREGVPIAIKSNMIQECLGNVLVRNGTLNEEQHQESLQRMKRGEGLQGEILVAMELVDEEIIANALQDQAREKLFEIFEWEQGTFRLERGGEIMRANAIALNTSPANLILEGVRHRYPASAVDKFLAAHRGRFLTPSKSPFHQHQEIDLDDEERMLVSQLDGLHPLEKYATSSASTRRALFGLLVTGMFELQDQEGSAADVEKARDHGAGRNVPPRNEVALRAEVKEFAQSLRGKNHFEMFGITQASTDADLESAYSELARRVHPDRYQTASLAVREMAAEVAQRASEAFETLRDKRCRQQYVLELQAGQRRAQENDAGKRSLAAETAFQKGMGLIQRREYEQALLQFGRALEGNADDGEYHAYYGWCLYLCHPDSSTMVGEAIEHVKRGAGMAVDREKPFLFLGRLYKVIGKVAVAEKMFTRAVQIQPECVEALRELRLINLRREKSKGLIGRLLRR